MKTARSGIVVDAGESTIINVFWSGHLEEIINMSKKRLFEQETNGCAHLVEMLTGDVRCGCAVSDLD